MILYVKWVKDSKGGEDMNYVDLPKIELHCHLDGSVRVETIYELAKKQGIQVPEDMSELKTKLVAPESCPSLDEYLKRFSLPVRVMQTKEALKRITFELFQDGANENIKYMEVRFGPLLHVNKGLDLVQVIESVLEGMNEACSKYDIQGNIIISALRTMPKDRLYELIDVGSQYLGKGVVAFDLASSELEGFAEDFKPYLDHARQKGYRVTIHAGETGVGQNVHDSILLLGAERIGHGIFIHDTPHAYDLVKERGTVLEVCPTSNVQTKAVQSMESHPMDDFYRDHIRVTINTDNRTVSDTSLTREVERVMTTFNWSFEDYKAVYEYAVEKAFAGDQVKEDLRQAMKAFEGNL